MSSRQLGLCPFDRSSLGWNQNYNSRPKSSISDKLVARPTPQMVYMVLLKVYLPDIFQVIAFGVLGSLQW